MARFILALLLFIATTAPSATTAFCPTAAAATRPLLSPRLFAAGENDDYDAPILTNTAPSYVLTDAPIVDDECYMGADSTYLDCIDFDPLTRPTRSVNAHDQPRQLPRWAYGDDNDAPTTTSTAPTINWGNAQLPIVDEDCYLGKDSSAEECVDFDPQIVKRRLVLANPKSAC
jgi:hypothetical protein